MRVSRATAKTLALTTAAALALVFSAQGRIAAQESAEHGDAGAKVTPAQAAAALPEGTTICAELTRTLDARKLKIGDKVEARTTLAVLARGIVAIPQGTKLLGHVTEAAARSDKSDRSVVGIVFDRVELKGSAEVPLTVTLQAVGERPLNAVAVPPEFGHSTDNSRLPLAAGQHNNQAPPEITSPVSPLPPADDLGSQNPILDASSRGAYGFPDVFLIESKDASRGSRVVSHKKNVKIGEGAEIVLRVIGPPRKFIFLP